MHQILRYGPIAPVLLGLIGLALLCPTTPESTFASPSTATPASQSDEPSSLSVSLDPNLSFDLTPDLEGSFQTASTNLRIATNHSTGYKAYLSADHQGALVNTNSAIPSTIKPVEGTMNRTNFHDHLNSWGYANLTSASATTLANANYTAIPRFATDTEIIATEAASSDQYNLGFAIAIGRDLPSGVYRNNIYLTVIANPAKLTLDSITTMQEITPEICANTPTPTTGTGVAVNSWKLTDTRDGKQYQVAKLKDGNCWMQENLGLTLSSSKPLTPEDSDLNYVTQLGNATYENNYTWTPINTGSSNSLSVNNIASWHPNAYWYYQWNAATAGTGASITTGGQNAQGSICPKGWRLPINGEYGTLVDTYGVNKDTITNTPLNFTRSGNVYAGRADNVGSHGYFWSATATSSSGAYDLVFIDSALYPSYTGNARYDGFSVRCIAR